MVESSFSSFSSWHLIQVDGIKEKTEVIVDTQTYETKFPTTYILVFLKGKNHILKSDKDLKIKVFVLNLDYSLKISSALQAIDSDRKPWLSLILAATPLFALSATVTYSRRKRDSDDVKIIIDGEIQGNTLKKIKHFLWRYAGSLLPKYSTKTDSERFEVSLLDNVHTVEFWSDRMPILNNFEVEFGIKLLDGPGVPTVNNPKWTEDFYDDTETMLLARAVYGEAESESFDAKIAVAWAIRNRVEDEKNRWGNIYHKVILQPWQYEPFNDSKSKTFQKIANPDIKDAWNDSYRAAETVIFGRSGDPTNGSNHFYSIIIDAPPWADQQKFIIQIGKTKFYKL